MHTNEPGFRSAAPTRGAGCTPARIGIARVAAIATEAANRATYREAKRGCARSAALRTVQTSASMMRAALCVTHHDARAAYTHSASQRHGMVEQNVWPRPS